MGDLSEASNLVRDNDKELSRYQFQIDSRKVDLMDGSGKNLNWGKTKFSPSNNRRKPSHPSPREPVLPLDEYIEQINKTIKHSSSKAKLSDFALMDNEYNESSKPIPKLNQSQPSEEKQSPDSNYGVVLFENESNKNSVSDISPSS